MKSEVLKNNKGITLIALIVTIIIYKPVSGMIINNTSIDEKVKDAIIQNTTNIINENEQIQDNNITNQVEDKILPEQAENIAKNVVYAVTAIVLFIVVKIILSIIISLMDFVANLPILKQFNEIGGIIYGIVRGLLIVCICILLIGVYAKINPENDLNNAIQNSHLTKIIYKNIVKF